MNAKTTDLLKALKRLKDSTKEISNKFSKIDSMNYEQLCAKYSQQINYYESLGAHGWVECQYMIAADESNWVNEILNSNSETVIEKYFSEEIITRMIEDLQQRYQSVPEKMYVNCALANFQAARYTESAIFLSALLDYRLTCITPDSYRKKSGQINTALPCKEQELFPHMKKKAGTKVILVCQAMPSFLKYASRLFMEEDQYNWTKPGYIEPPYLNRNWLMHGRRTKPVERYECIQLMNALITWIFIEEEVESYEQQNGQTSNANP